MYYSDIIKKYDASSYIVGISQLERVIEMGCVLGLDENTRMLDLCCGYGEILRVLSEAFGIQGTGMDLAEEFIRKGSQRIAQTGLSDRIKLELGDARKCRGTGYDVANIFDANEVFEGFENALLFLKKHIKSQGKIILGEVFYTQKDVPQELIDFEGNLLTEADIYGIALRNGYAITFIGRDTPAEWDRYIAWSARRIVEDYRKETEPQEKAKQLEWLRKWYDMYVHYRERYQRYAIFVLEKLD